MQGQSGFGLDAQEEQIRDFAAGRGYRIQRCFRDVHTGRGGRTVDDRRELRKALKLSREKGWPIIFADVPRFGRNESAIAEALDDPDVTVIDGFTGSSDKDVIRALARRAEKEGDMISERTKAKFDMMRTQGIELGNRESLPRARDASIAAKQWRAKTRVLEYEPILREIQSEGAVTAREFAEGLNLRGYRTGKGKRWSKDNVRRLLRKVLPNLDKPSIDPHYADVPGYGAF
jgi:DNA invertase Pin-like site-specific DNA recombinase